MGLDSSSIRHDVRGRTDRQSVTFDFAALEALPDVRGSKQRKFSAEEDDALLRYWPVKRHEDVAKVIGVSESTARRRYRELIIQTQR